MAPTTLENPLRGGESSVRTADPCVMVIFGASGDLTQRMLIPSLFDLAQERLIPPEFTVLGLSRREFSDAEIRERYKPKDADLKWENFAQSIFYMAGNHRDPATYEQLKAKLEQFDKERGTQGNRLFYLSITPNDFPVVLENLGKAGMINPPSDAGSNAWVRIILEKPFGTSLDSAIQLNKDCHRIVPEKQLYRIDHYLGKETVQNILSLRFANSLFEPLWNRRYIEHIQIVAAENLGVEERAGYYDTSGALRDMVQNHLLQLVALVAMEWPVSFADDSVRDEKGKVFKALRHYSPEDVDKNAIRGQYRAGFIDGKAVQGYTSEKDVPAGSQTETFAAVRFWVDNWRWQGVPIYVRTGKRLPRKVTEIAIVFRQVPHQLFTQSSQDGLEPNLLVLRIGPEEGISLRFGTKVPGMTRRLRWVNMDFDYGSSFSRPSPPAYARLLHDCMIGDPTLYTRGDQIELAWQVTQPILDRWASSKTPIPTYEAGTWGPREAETWMEDENRLWRKL